MPTQPFPLTERKLVLVRAEFDPFMAALECHNNSAIAEHLGLSRTTVSKIRSGKQEPGSVFIAALLDTFPRVDIRRFIAAQRTGGAQ